MLPKNVISWFHLPTADFDRAAKFYSEILGNPVNVMDFNGQKMGFFPMLGGPESEGVGGALMPPLDDDKIEWKPSHNGAQIFLSAEGTIETMLSKIDKAGGKILAQKTAIGDAGFFAFIEDTEGNKVGLHSRT